MLKIIKSELEKHRLASVIFIIVLFVAIFLRVYRVSETLGFYFDQGRDAMVIADFLKNGNLFLVGPTTGIAGILRGPWFYWLITPAYFLGGGDPVYPAVLLSITTIVAIGFLYSVATELVNRRAGLLAAIIGAGSYYILVHSRWLSNPTPMLLISTMLLWSMSMALKKKIWSWPLVGLLVGMAIQFGSATEIFYIPTVIIFAVWQRRSLPKRNVLIVSLLLFFISFIPQIAFDIVKHGVMSSALLDFLFNRGTFKLSIWEIIGTRTSQYYYLFTSILYPGERGHLLPFIFLGLGVIFANFKFFWGKPMFRMLLLFITLPLVGMFFFQGNYGNVFDYYFSGYYFPMILLFALPLGYAAKNWGGQMVVVVFILLFIQINSKPVGDFLQKGRTHFTFEDQKKAVEWVYQDAAGRPFNVDIYVPPVIPYAYDYLFLWKAQKYGNNPADDNVELLYTLYEQDPPEPERLATWMKRQDTIGIKETEIMFHGVGVERRTRLK